MKIPYIGITDFMTGEQARTMLRSFGEYRSGMGPRKLMVGVMMSYKTLNGLPTKWADAFPKNVEVPTIFIDHPLAFNTLHYADYDEATSTSDILSMMQICLGGNLHAVQLDMPWPEWRLLEAIKRFSGWRVETVLQIGKNALDQCNNDPQEVCFQVERYGRLIDYVLLDKSMGQGKGMDAQILLPFVRAIAEAFPGLGIAVAGGLGPTTTHLVDPIIQEFPHVSIDAQGQLRSSGSALDPIERNRAEEYLRQASKLFP
jgi:hypothetical protein